MEKELYQKKLKMYKKLGAEKFQDIVFAFERFKFKVIDKLFPNLLKKMEQRINKNMQKQLEKASTEEERQRIIEDTKKTILALRKEFHTRKNINYHMNKNNPTEIIDYLKLNKKIHKNNLIFNGVLITLSILGIVFHIPGAIALLVIEALSGIVNFECINIQNYNLCRIERIKEKLEKREARKREQETGHEKAHELIYEKVIEGEKLPSMTEIIGSATTKEQLEQIRSLLLKEIKSRGINISGGSLVK